jgi:hypothetical protein
MMRIVPIVAAATLLASSSIAAAVRPGDALPPTPEASAQNPQAGTVTSGRAGPQANKKKRRFFGVPLLGIEALMTAGSGIFAANVLDGSSSPNQTASPQ